MVSESDQIWLSQTLQLRQGHSQASAGVTVTLRFNRARISFSHSEVAGGIQLPADCWTQSPHSCRTIGQNPATRPPIRFLAGFTKVIKLREN